MPFTNADEVVRYIGGIFETAFATEGIGDKLGATGIVLLVKSTDPESPFAVDMSNRKVLPGMTGPERVDDDERRHAERLLAGQGQPPLRHGVRAG